jgi:predicted amidohydrolase
VDQGFGENQKHLTITKRRSSEDNFSDVICPSGEIQHYDKKTFVYTHLGEDKVYNGIKLIVDCYLGWKICPLVCYDLRFSFLS